MAYPGRVRIAEKKDEEQVLKICRNLSEENGMFPMSESKVNAMLQRAFAREGGILGLIGDDPIEGMVYMLVSSLWYTDEPFLDELFLYVSPEHRKSRNAIELMNFAKWCSDESGIPLVIGVISNQKTEGKVRLYQRQFKQPAGNFFFYKKDGAEARA